MRLTSVDVLMALLRLHALHGVIRRLDIELVADCVATALIQCILESIALPAEHIVAVRRVS